MSAAKKLQPITIDHYLARELDSRIKHEYLGGFVYAIVRERNSHNLIATNTLGGCGIHLRGKKCRPFNSDTKIRIRLPGHTRFYYPDVSVICRPNPQTDSFQDEPAVLVEVISEKTRRIDEGEKKDAYLTIPSLFAYILVEQETPAVVVHRRTEQGFVREVYQGLDAIVPLHEIDIDLPLSQIYDGTAFIAEPAEDADEVD